MTSKKIYWSDNSKIRKYADGRGRILLKWETWMGREWIDLRLYRRHEEGEVATRRGVRITPNQLRDMLPSLVELLEHIDDYEEEKERKKNASKERKAR